MRKYILSFLILTAVAMAYSGIPSTPFVPANKSYNYIVKLSTYAPVTVQLTGLGNSWIFSVAGGTATFKINNGQEIVLPQEMTLGNDFKFISVNPSVTLTGLQTGATAFIFIDGGN